VALSLIQGDEHFYSTGGSRSTHAGTRGDVPFLPLRHGRLNIMRLVDQYGPDMPMLLDELAADCPRFQAKRWYDRCGAMFPQLVQLFGGPRTA
jgi:hypothetical protein